jgi:hypothetical protein
MNARAEADRIDDQVETAKATILVGGCGIVFGFGNAIVVATVGGIGPDTAAIAFFVVGWVGVIGAQGALHAIWCVLAPVPGRIRLAVAVGLAVFWYGAFLFGVAVVGGPDDEFGEGALTGLLCLPLICLGFQMPLWLVRFWLRWRIVHEGNDSVGSRMTTLRLRHILVGMAGIALALGTARMAKPDGVDSEAAFVLWMFIPALLFLLLSAGTTLPLLIVTMYPRNVALPLSILGGVLLAIVVVGFSCLALFIRDLNNMTAAMVVSGGVACLIGGYLAGIVGVLLIARGLGYRLRWGRQKKAEAGESPFKSEADLNEELAKVIGDTVSNGAAPDDIVFEP